MKIKDLKKLIKRMKIKKDFVILIGKINEETDKPEFLYEIGEMFQIDVDRKIVVLNIKPVEDFSLFR